MTLPAPGNSISANQINVEAERSGTSNAPLSGSSSTPQTGSLVKIYSSPNSDVNQVAPHKYSEFYSKTFTPDNIPQCGGTLNVSGGVGYYTVSINLGAATGAVVIYFAPALIPDGIAFDYNSTVYNKLTAPFVPTTVPRSPLTAAANTLNFVGYISNTSCSSTDLVNNSPYNLTNYTWNGSAFTASGGSTSVVTSSVNLLGSTVIGQVYTLVVPKTNASVTTGQLRVAGPCSSTGWSVQVSCPTTLFSWSTCSVQLSAGAACTATQNQTYYFARNATFSSSTFTDQGNTVPSTNNFVFSDGNGTTPLSNGFYRLTSASTMQVNDGIVTDIQVNVCLP